tara:strand:+ start:220 stop:594 length:375 start_codon:yes stop_codon:yes gene_type:complete
MTLKYFTRSEFDSPDLEGSGDKMSIEFLELLDEAREIAEIPFKINSGFRTQAYHDSLTKRGYKTDKNSPHKKGLAADISVTNSRNRWVVLNSLLLVGFTRFGIADTFIHVDLDTERKQNIIWTY